MPLLIKLKILKLLLLPKQLPQLPQLPTQLLPQLPPDVYLLDLYKHLMLTLLPLLQPLLVILPLQLFHNLFILTLTLLVIVLSRYKSLNTPLILYHRKLPITSLLTLLILRFTVKTLLVHLLYLMLGILLLWLLIFQRLSTLVYLTQITLPLPLLNISVNIGIPLILSGKLMDVLWNLKNPLISYVNVHIPPNSLLLLTPAPLLPKLPLLYLPLLVHLLFSTWCSLSLLLSSCSCNDHDFVNWI